jgi:hypothetical protein
MTEREWMVRTLKVKGNKRGFWRKVLLRIGFFQRKPLPKRESDPRLNEIKSFDEWLAYIKEKDPAAYDELINLGKTPFVRETKFKRERVN